MSFSKSEVEGREESEIFVLLKANSIFHKIPNIIYKLFIYRLKLIYWLTII